MVRTLDAVCAELVAMAHAVEVFGPDRFSTIPCPTYPEIRPALFPGRRLEHLIGKFAPDAIHIATEGPLGFAAPRMCLRRKLPFTTAYHTRFPEYVRARIFFPMAWTRGVDLDLCKPREPGPTPDDGKRPIFRYVGRVVVEKNIKAFLKLDLPGEKWVVGGTSVGDDAESQRMARTPSTTHGNVPPRSSR